MKKAAFCCGDVMAERFADQFYGSYAWQQCRRAYKEAKGRLCERCLAKGLINPGSRQNPLQVHHKIHLTEENLMDPTISLNWDNLELLCQQCHLEEHADDHQNTKRWRVDENGRVEIR